MISPAALSVRVASSSDPARLASLRTEWADLLAAATDPNPFLSWEWLHTWWRHFGGRRPLLVLEARDGGRLVGLAALCGGRGAAGSRRFRFLGNGITGADGLDLLLRRDATEAGRAALCRAIVAEVARWDCLDLEDLPCGSPTPRALRAALPPGVRMAVRRRFVCPGFALTGTFEEHLRRMRRRETYGRRVRWLERQPGYAVEVATTPAEAAAAMEDFLRLHRLRWQSEGGSYGIPPGAAEDFHREVGPLLAERGWLRLYRMLLGGSAIAAVYGIEMGRRFFYYQSAFDPAWAQRSPGVVLVGETVKDAYARGLTDYDFMRGTEPYKLEWGQDRRDTCAVRLRPPGLRAGAAAAAEGAWHAGRALARAVAPRPLWAALRRARRRAQANGSPMARATETSGW